MSQSILSLFGIDDFLPGLQNRGQEISGLQDGSASIDDDFALFIDWEPDVPQQCPRKRPERFASHAQKSVNDKVPGKCGRPAIRPNSESSTVAPIMLVALPLPFISNETQITKSWNSGSFYRFQLKRNDTQQRDQPISQVDDLLQSPPAPIWSEDIIGPSAQHWEDALRMIETLQGKNVWPTKEEDIQQVVEAEDKRRRNNAASARFRVKKKQREEELKKKVRGLKEKTNDLAARIAQLEQENRDLRKMVLFMEEK
ncbi:uncharacterized protein IWZ02DRAFT_499968 [Phyllosticta citriasiana]|uniref:uncharacterized protein n=1 Tax=Phyllosticta citriasiana TaxID=595635 RepID=UPI0030FD908F